MPHRTGGTAPGAWGRGAGYGPGDGYAILGVGYCPPIPGSQGPEDIGPQGPKGPASGGSLGVLHGLGSSEKGILGVGYGPAGPGGLLLLVSPFIPVNWSFVSETSCLQGCCYLWGVLHGSPV